MLKRPVYTDTKQKCKMMRYGITEDFKIPYYCFSD